MLYPHGTIKELPHDKTNHLTCASSKDTDQTGAHVKLLVSPCTGSNHSKSLSTILIKVSVVIQTESILITIPESFSIFLCSLRIYLTSNTFSILYILYILLKTLKSAFYSGVLNTSDLGAERLNIRLLLYIYMYIYVRSSKHFIAVCAD